MVRVLAPRRQLPRFIRSGLASFLWLGAFHDAYWFFTKGALVTSGLLGFGTWGLVLWLWQTIDGVVASRRTAWQRLAGRQLSRLATIAVLCLSVSAFL